MTEPAPDVALAVEMLTEWDVQEWGRLADGMSQPRPRITANGGDRLEAFQFWAASNAGSPRSHVEAAVSNTARIAADLNGVFGYDAELKDGYTAAYAWYRNVEAGKKRDEALGDWEVHTLLIHNLAVELIRSINLVIQRVEQADPARLRSRSLAVVCTGSNHALVEAVSYSIEESELAQPYPGLRGFPAVIQSRNPGTLGHHPDGTLRKPAEFERWIEIVEGVVGEGSSPAPQVELPFCLQAAGEKGGAEMPSRWTALVGALTLAGLVITIAAAPPWFAAAAIGAALTTCALRRRVWRPRPSAWGLLVVAVIAAACGAGAYFLFESSSGRPPRSQAAAGGLTGQGVGQIGAGNITRASAGGASGTYSDPLRVTIGSTATVAIRLSNVGPDELLDTRVSARLPSAAAPSQSIELVARPRNANPATVADTATIEVEGGRSGCLAYIPGSARIYDQHFGLIRRLPDAIVGTGASVGPLGVAIEDVRFVGLEVKLVEPRVGSVEGSCGRGR